MTFHTAIYYRLMGYYETLQFVGNNYSSIHNDYRLLSLDRQWYMDILLKSYELEKDIDDE